MALDQNAIQRVTVNNAMRDPLQGFDAEVYVLDQGSGQQLMVGRFTSFQLTVRNATEPYLEFNQRIPRMLDGEFQFGWVLERGLIDVRVLENVYGARSLYREQRLSRSPRMMINVELNAPELDEGTVTTGSGSTFDASVEPVVGGTSDLVQSRTNRKSIGTYRLTYAKVDSLTLGMMAGRSVIATRMEGLCEGAHFVETQNMIDPGLYYTSEFQRTNELEDPNNYFATSVVPDWVSFGGSAVQ